MVIGYHLVFATYGFWLPNDPRGSWSKAVWSEPLRVFGEATTVNTSRSLANKSHSRVARLAAKEHLQYSPVVLTDLQRQAAGIGLVDIAEKLKLVIHACAIMPDHVHLVTMRHRLKIEEVSGACKRAATRALNEANLHPLVQHRRANGRIHSPWVVGQWKVFLDTPQDVCRCIRYVEGNLVKAGMPEQSWEFVTEYNP